MVICLIFGGLFVLKIPMLWGTDETFHTMRVYQLAQRQLFADYLGESRSSGGYGGKIPVSLYGLVLNVNHDQLNNDPSRVPYGFKNIDDKKIYQKIGGQRLNNGGQITYAFPNTAAYSPVPYLPALSGMVIAKHYNYTLKSTIIFLRILGLLAYTALIYTALRLTAKSALRWIIFITALLPMAVFQSAIISVDALTIAGCLLFLALLIKFFEQRESPKSLPKPYIAGLMLTAALLPLLKPGYVALVPLVFLIPSRSIGSYRAATAYKIAAVLIPAVFFAVWSSLTKDMASAVALIKPGNGQEAIDFAAQLGHIIHHPLSYAVTIVRNSILNDTRYFTEMIGVLGFNIVAVPGIVIVMEALAFVIAAVTAGTAKISKSIGYWMIGAAGLSWLMIITALYLSYSAVGAPEISGIQGRYFLPVLPFFLVGVALLIKDRAAFTPRLNAAPFIYGLVTASLILSSIKYWYITG